MKTFELLLQLELEDEIDIFRSYLAAMEDFLENEVQYGITIKALKVSDAGVDEAGEVLTEEVREHYVQNTIDQFANMLRRTIFVSLYSFLESRLIKECRSRKNPDIPINFSEIAGQSEIERAKIYFNKVLQIEFPSDTPEWQQQIVNYRLLRNCIVHCESTVSEMKDAKDQDKLRKYIDTKHDLSLRDDEIFFDKSFCFEVHATIKAFLGLLFLGSRNFGEQVDSPKSDKS
jgi:hypothetical protein